MKLFGRSNKTITISSETIIKTIALTVAAYLVLQFAGNAAHQLRLVVVAAFLALALNPAVTAITKRLRSKSRVRATGMAYLAVVGVLTLFGVLVLPPLVRQTADFINDVPRIVTDFQSNDTALSNFVRQYGLDDEVRRIANDFGDRFNEFSGPILSTASRIGGTVVSLITVFILTFMMLVEGPIWYRRFLAMQESEKRKSRDRVAHKMYRVVTGYVNGQVLLAAISAGSSLIALLIASTLLNVSVNAVALAGIVFLFGLIPLIGNILAAGIVALFSLFASTPLALIMLAYFLVYQQIENATLQPYIQSRSNQLTPLIVFVAALLGVGLGGILGALAAIPLAGCVRVLLEEKYGERLFADEVSEPKETTETT